MNLIDKNQYTFSSELPGPCKILYETVKNCELDMEFDLGVMDMKLSDAIRYSRDSQQSLIQFNLLPGTA